MPLVWALLLFIHGSLGATMVCPIFEEIQSDGLSRGYEVDFPKADEICLIEGSSDIIPDDPWANVDVVNPYFKWLSKTAQANDFKVRLQKNSICLLHTSTSGNCAVQREIFFKDAPQV